MTQIDYVVIASYAACLVGVGLYYARRAITRDDYLLGGRRMNPWMIGLSLFATLTSTLSYLAMPGEMIKHGPMMFAQVTAFPIVAWIVGWWLIPFIMRLDVTSGYELLETRLGLTGRMLGSIMFVCLRTIWMASILYATSDKVIVPILGGESDRAFWTPVCSALLGALTIVYTAQGGMRAVVAADAIQSLVMFGGALATVAIINHELGGLDQWWPSAWLTHWEPPAWGFEPAARATLLSAFVNMLVWMTCTAGSDQMAIQRYLSTRDVRTARRSFNINLCTSALSIFMMAVVGLAVLGYFKAHPERLSDGQSLTGSADELFPRFIVLGLPAGATGFVIAALLSAAMSSLSSGMNSVCAVITTDFIGRFRAAQPSQQAEVHLNRVISVAVGLLAVALSSLVGLVAQNLMELCIKLVNLLTAPLFVLFFLAMFVPWATPAGAVAATFVSTAVAVAIAFYSILGIGFMWSGLGALVAGVIAGTAVSALDAGLRRKPARDAMET